MECFFQRGTSTDRSCVGYCGKYIMPRAGTIIETQKLTLEEWRERRSLRREKQRKNNVVRAAKMHKARLKAKAEGPKRAPGLKKSVYVGCSGWRYWKWRDSFYEGVPQSL
jgi:hypothetical protein